MKHKRSGRSVVETGRATPSTLWIFPEGDLTGFRATGRRNISTTGPDGQPMALAFAWVMAGGTIPPFDPQKARYATSDYVANISARAGITIFGDTCSARRLLRESHSWKQVMDLDGALAHKYLGVDIAREVIINSYAVLADHAEITLG